MARRSDALSAPPRAGSAGASGAAARRSTVATGRGPLLNDSRHASRRLTGWFRSLLRIPLASKLAGANTLIIVVASVTLFVLARTGATRGDMVAMLIAALVASLIVNLVLVHVALLPLRDLEEAAGRVWRGELEARIPPSPLADREMTRIGGTFNLLLDRLIADRTRVRQLAAQVIQAGEDERSRIARELHDSTAQTLAALALQTTSALGSDPPPELRKQLELIAELAADALEEVRALSHTVHPRVLEDLGLAAGLAWLARRTTEEYGLEVSVDASGDLRGVSHPIASVLYRVAQEAVANIVRHAAALHARLVLAADDGVVRLEVIDDGRGFDLEDARRRRPGMGLFTMEERLVLIDGQFAIHSAPGRGTRAVATVPFDRSRAP